MTSEEEEAEIRSIMQSRARAVHEKDVEGAVSALSPEIHLFDAMAPLQDSGISEAKRRTADWFSSYQGPIGYEIRDLQVVAGREVAFCHYLYRVRGSLKDGAEIDMWVRATAGFRKIDAKWKITHEHHSVPFDPRSFATSFDLRP